MSDKKYFVVVDGEEVEIKPIIEEAMKYIKEVEVYDDAQSGNYREFEQIEKSGDAPEIYRKLKELKDNM